MPYRALFIGLFVFLLLFSGLPANAVETKKAAASRPGASALPQTKSGDLYALVVGISKYKDPRVPRLDLSDKDAKEFGDFLTTQQGIFRNTNVTFLMNEKATKSEVEKYLYYALPKASKDDTVILFFSGHGGFDPLRPNDFLFLPHDAEPDYLGTTSVKMSGLDFLKGLNAERVLIIADACYAGGFSQMKAKALSPSLELFLQEAKSSSGRAIITSARSGELSWESPDFKNSIFTHSFLEGLKGKADKDHDGLVTLNEAYEYAYSITKKKTEGRQHPQFEGKVVGAFPLSFVGPRVPVAELKKRLFMSAETGNLEKLQDVMGQIADVDVRDERNATPLISAAAHGQSEAVKLLLAKGADVNAVYQEGATALSSACRAGHEQVVPLLLAHGADVNQKNGDGYTPLAFASVRGHARIAELLLEKGANVRARTNAGDTALSLAAGAGRLDLVKLLVDWGADINSADLESATPLIRAARAGHLDIIKYLLTRGADVLVTGKGAAERSLMMAVLSGNLEETNRALSGIIDVNAHTESKDSALMFAAGLGHSDTVSLLVSKGAIINFRGSNGYTALMRAAENGHADVVKVLLDAGALPNAQAANGNTALILTVEKGRVDAVKALCEKKSDVNVAGSEGNTPLIVAARNGHREVVRYLMSVGSDKNAKNRDGDTALIAAADGGHVEIVKFLLTKGVEINGANNRQKTALMKAVQNGHKGVAKILLAEGADTAAQDWEGKSALTVASEAGKQDMVDLLLTKQ
jgi:ankyrin repeat protein